MTNFRFFLLAVCAAQVMLHTVSAQEVSPKRLAIGLEAAVPTGAGIELATPLGKRFALRGGFSLLPINYNTSFKVKMSNSMANRLNAEMSKPDIKDALREFGLPTRAEDIRPNIDLQASLKFLNGKILMDCYPFKKSSFHLTGGLYIGKSQLLNVNGQLREAVDVLNVLKKNGINFFDDIYVTEYNLTAKEMVDVQAALNINSVKPYFGLGLGRAIPKRRVNAGFEIGAFYMGKSRITSENVKIQNLINDEFDTIGKMAKIGKFGNLSGIMKKVQVMPVLSFKINIAIF